VSSRSPISLLTLAAAAAAVAVTGAKKPWLFCCLIHDASRDVYAKNVIHNRRFLACLRTLVELCG
jgi:hypothetical protein